MRSRQDRRWGALWRLTAVLLVVGSACTGRAPTTAPRPSDSSSRAPAVGGAAARAGGLIYFWASHDYPAELWSMWPDGSHQRLLFKTPLWAKRPAPSPDGRWIAFDGAPQDTPLPSDHELQTSDDFDVQIIRVDGSGRRTLAGTPEREVDAQWSPDGSQLSYSRWRGRGPDAWRRSWIWTVGSDGRGARRLARGVDARWSPDGSRLVLDAPTPHSDGDLFVVAARSGRVLRRLTATPAAEEAAAWSPDGSRILFTRFSPESPWLAEVFVVNADSTGERRLTQAAGDDVAAAWSPDGRKIAFTSARSGSDQIFVMNADGTDQHNLSRNSFDDEATSWQ